MPVFNYALRRILTSASTYVILGIFTIIPLIATLFVRSSKEGVVQVESVAAVLINISWISSWFFVSFFLATVISKIISEEISDGSFLLIISKPLSRTRILLEKLLAITIVSVVGFLIAFFTPMIGSIISAKNAKSLFYWLSYHHFWRLFYYDLIAILIIISVFSILAIYLSPRGISTIISLFVSSLFAIEITLRTAIGVSLIGTVTKFYVYIPVIFASIILVPVNLYLFKHKSFG